MEDKSKQMLRRKFLKTGCLSGIFVTSPLLKDVFCSSHSGSQVLSEKPLTIKNVQKLQEIAQKYGSEFGDIKVKVLN